MKLRVAAAAVAAALIAVVCADLAAGASWATHGAVDAVELAGHRAMWAVERRSGFDLFASRHGEGRRLRSFRSSVPGDADAVFLSPLLAATSSKLWIRIERIVVEENPQVHDVPPTHRSLAGPLDGPFSEFARCDNSTFPGRGGLDAGAQVLALSRCDGSAEVHYPPTTAEPQIVGGNVDRIRVAGSYVAWQDGQPEGGDRNAPESIVVYDAATMREVYRIDAAGSPPQINSFTLDSDGTVAFAFDPDLSDAHFESRLGWASAEEPFVHELALPARILYTLKMAAGKLAFVRSLERSGSPNHSELGITDLQGHNRLLARDSKDFNLDFDGKRLLYVKRTCHGSRITRRDLADIHRPIAAPRCKPG